MALPNRHLIKAVRMALRGAANPENAAPMQAYMKSALPFLGVKKPDRVKALKPIFASHGLVDAEVWRATVLALFDQARYREEWYAALDLLGRRQYVQWLDMQALGLCEFLIVQGAWWDIVDAVATRRLGHVLAHHRAALTPILKTWAQDEDRWKRRTAVLAQLKHGQETDVTLLAFAIKANLDDPDFFLRKGIGWALRQYARTDADWVEAFCQDHWARLSPLSRREALRVLRKSGRAVHLV